MPGRHPQIDTDYQGRLLSLVGEGQEVIPAESFPDDGPQEKILGRPVAYTVVYGPEGSYKDLTERAEELQGALGALSLRNQRMGFAVASNTRRHNAPIYGRYREGVPFVQSGANRNTNRYLKEAKEYFWKATGFSALRGSGLMNNQQINTRALSMWEKFSARYGTPVNDEDRENTARIEYQKKLNGILKMTEAVKLNRAA